MAKTISKTASQKNDASMEDTSQMQDQGVDTTTSSEIQPDSVGPLKEFFIESLKDMYWAEKALVEALPKMQRAATTDELQEAIEDHTLQTTKHVSRLEKVFKLLGIPAEAKKCDVMQALIEGGQKAIDATPSKSMTRDAALIISAQKVEHHEIACYGGLVQLALTLGEADIAELLSATLYEEEDTDNDLTDIAETYINFAAEEETQEDIEDIEL